METISGFLNVLKEYGAGTAITLFAVFVLGWVLRVGLKNPLEAVSDALEDVDRARRVLHEELATARAVIAEQKQVIDQQREYIAQLESRVQRLEEILGE